MLKRMYKEGKSYRLIAKTITKKYAEHLPNGAISHNGVRSVLQKTRKEVMV